MLSKFVHKALGRLVQYAAVVVPVGAVDIKGIRAAAASRAANLTGYLADALADPGKHTVAILLSIAFVEHVEMADIQHDGIHRHIRVMLVIQPDEAEEIIEIEEVCQTVALRRLDDAPLFGKPMHGAPFRICGFVEQVSRPSCRFICNIRLVARCTIHAFCNCTLTVHRPSRSRLFTRPQASSARR